MQRTSFNPAYYTLVPLNTDDTAYNPVDIHGNNNISADLRCMNWADQVEEEEELQETVLPPWSFEMPSQAANRKKNNKNKDKDYESDRDSVFEDRSKQDNNKNKNVKRGRKPAAAKPKAADKKADNEPRDTRSKSRPRDSSMGSTLERDSRHGERGLSGEELSRPGSPVHNTGQEEVVNPDAFPDVSAFSERPVPNRSEQGPSAGPEGPRSSTPTPQTSGASSHNTSLARVPLIFPSRLMGWQSNQPVQHENAVNRSPRTCH